MKYAYIRALSIFEDRGGVGVFYYTVHKPRAKRPRSLEAAQRCVVVGDGGVVNKKGSK